VTSLTEVPGEPSSAVTGPGGSLSDQLDGAHVAVVGLGRTGRARSSSGDFHQPTSQR